MSKVHIVEQGECLTAIAVKYGFKDYQTIYEHPDNAEFRKLRPNPNVIAKGDRIRIPDLAKKETELKSGQSLDIVVDLPERELVLELRDVLGKVIMSTDYVLVVDNEERKGKTESDGVIRSKVPAGTKSVRLRVLEEEFELFIGYLNPMTDVADGGVSGVKSRLQNLGHYIGDVDINKNPAMIAAIQRFQFIQHMEPDGQIKNTLITKLLSEHSC